MNIELPNGEIAEFPDNMPREEIKSIIQKKFPPKNQGFLERVGNDVEEHINKPIESLGRAGRDILGGAAQGLANIVPGLYNLGASGVNALGGNVPKSQMFDFVPHSPSQKAGEIGSFFAGPGLLKGLSRIPELTHTVNSAMKIPLIAHTIKHASNILSKSPTASRIVGNSLLGGAYNPENPLLGLGLGAAGGAAGELVNKGYSGIKNAIIHNESLRNTASKFMPGKHASELESQLSHGANNITENSAELVKDIRKAHDMRNEEASVFYNFALDKAGNEPIYRTHSLILNKPDESLSTLNKIKDLKVGELFDIFKTNPTFMNAHNLQSELGALERTLKNNPQKSIADNLEINKINTARQQLNHDISTFLKRHDESSNVQIGPMYHKASELFKENVAPYLEGKKLLEITKNRKTNIKNIHDIFNNPTNTVTKEGIEQIGNINKIIKDLPETARNRILYDALGGNKLSPEAMLKKLNELKGTGYGEYFTPEIEQSLNALSKKVKNKEMLKAGAKIAGVGTVGGLVTNAISHLF